MKEDDRPTHLGTMTSNQGPAWQKSTGLPATSKESTPNSICCKVPLFYFHQVAILLISSWQDPEIDQDISKWWLIGTGYLVN